MAYSWDALRASGTDVIDALFEHIAIVHRPDTFGAWQRLLIEDLGGVRGLGGAEPALAFRGGQITYPDAGMLELLTWIEGPKPGAMQRYLEKTGQPAALHHITFVVENIEAAAARCDELDLEILGGRNRRHWKEFYLRAPFLRPNGMLIQVLRADKAAIQRETPEVKAWPGFDPALASHPEPVSIVGLRVATDVVAEAEHVFCALLGAERITGSDLPGHTLVWSTSSMRLVLEPGAGAGDSFIEVAPPEERREELQRRLVSADSVPNGAQLLRLSAPNATGGTDSQ